MYWRSQLRGGVGVAARGAVRGAAAERDRRWRNPAMRGGLRRGPVRRVGPQGEDEDVELLQLVLLLHGGVDTARCDGGRLHPRQRRVGMGTGRADDCNGNISRVLRRGLPDVPKVGAFREPVHSAGAGCGGCSEEEKGGHGR